MDRSWNGKETKSTVEPWSGKAMKAMLSNGDTLKTALNAPRTAQKYRADKLYLKTKRRTE